MYYTYFFFAKVRQFVQISFTSGTHLGCKSHDVASLSIFAARQSDSAGSDLEDSLVAVLPLHLALEMSRFC